MGITENIDEDPKKFAVWTNNQGKGSELYFLTARSSSVKKAFVSAIKAILDSQLEQLKGILHWSWNLKTITFNADCVFTALSRD